MKSPAAELRRKSPPLAIHSSNSALRNAASIDRSQLNSCLMPTTIPQRILLQVAVGAGLVIAVATGVTYGIVYNAAKQGDLKQLETYVTERARREEIGFQQVEADLTLVRGQFLKRMEAPVPRDFQKR